MILAKIKTRVIRFFIHYSVLCGVFLKINVFLLLFMFCDQPLLDVPESQGTYSANSCEFCFFPEIDRQC